SHDRWFLDRVATAILAFEGDGRVVLYEGSFSDYERRGRAARATADAASAAERRAAGGGAGRRSGRTTSGPRKLTFKEARELEGIADGIGAAEAHTTVLEATLSDPEVYKARATEVPALVADLEAARAEVERLYARWQELEAIATASATS